MPIARLISPPPPTVVAVTRDEMVAPAEPAAPAAAPKVKAADPAIHPTGGWIVTSYILVALGAVAGIILWNLLDPGGFKPQPDISAFAVLFIFAQAIERALEPLTKFSETVGLDKEGAVKERDQAVEALHTAVATEKAEEEKKQEIGDKLANLATKQRNVDQVRANLAVLVWAIASVVAMAVCGAFGVLLLTAIGLDAPEWFDIVVTGLAVGSGTKPLHDLISNVQKAKEQREDPVETTT